MFLSIERKFRYFFDVHAATHGVGDNLHPILQLYKLNKICSSHQNLKEKKRTNDFLNSNEYMNPVNLTLGSLRYHDGDIHENVA